MRHPRSQVGGNGSYDWGGKWWEKAFDSAAQTVDDSDSGGSSSDSSDSDSGGCCVPGAGWARLCGRHVPIQLAAAH